MLNQVKSYIRKSQTEAAIYLLGDMAKNNEEFTRIISLNARYSSLKKAIIEGRITWQEEEASRSAINDSLLELCSLLEKVEVSKTSNPISAHILHQFPIGPRVDITMIPQKIIETYANLIFDPIQITMIISEAIQFRKEANQDALTISLAKLPPVNNTPALYFWQLVFVQAGLQGPRMLASLLLTVPDDQFLNEVKKLRSELIIKLTKHQQ